MCAMRKHIIIKFDYPKDIEYSEYVNHLEILYLHNKKFFFYDENTTIRDVLIKISRRLKSSFEKRGHCTSLNWNSDMYLFSGFKLFYNNDWCYIFDLNTKIFDVVKTAGNSLVLLIYVYVDKGGGIFDAEGIHFFMNSKESGKHHLPHVHVSYQGEEASISLDGKVLAGGINKKKQKVAIRIINNNKADFLFKWNTLTDGENFVLSDGIIKYLEN